MSPELLEYCIKDVEFTTKMWNLRQRWRGVAVTRWFAWFMGMDMAKYQGVSDEEIL